MRSNLKMNLKLLIFLSLFCFAAKAQNVKTYVYKTIKDKELSLDVYSPSSGGTKTAKPAIILFHGGGLVTGNKSSLKNQCTFFADKGLVAITASYRLLIRNSSDAKDSVFKCIEDAKSAVRWVKLHATELGIDTGKVILGGASAGGFLATEAALNPSINAPGDDLSVGTKAQALILLNPAFTPTHRYGPDVLLFVNQYTPPSIAFYGDNDKFKAGGMKYLEKMDSLGIKTDYWIAKNETHSYYSKPQWETLTTQLAYNFLIEAKVIKGRGLPIINNIYAVKPAGKNP